MAVLFWRLWDIPTLGLPFGQDRLIPLWVATLAVRQKSKTILFRLAESEVNGARPEDVFATNPLGRVVEVLGLRKADSIRAKTAVSPGRAARKAGD